jgi:N-acetylmuramic acid 6-phosphate etherase
MTTANLNTRGHLLTEQVNVNSANLDRLSTLELVDLFNKEDVNTLNAIAGARAELAAAIDTIADSLRQGGRLFYIGAGTSGRVRRLGCG